MSDTAEHFRRLLTAEHAQPVVLELGTRRWGPDPTHHGEWLPDGALHRKADVEDGRDVDVVVDAHQLAATWPRATFDAVIAASVFEHLQRPWIAAAQIGQVVRPGGLVYVATHQSFPLHGYPCDFFRFSVEALVTIFDDAGFDQVAAGYAHRCTIVPPKAVKVWNEHAEAWLNVAYLGRRRP